MNIISSMINKEKTHYNFKAKCTGVAGFCPDCGNFVSWNSYHSRFECLGNDCCFMANEKCERIWDNTMRDENLKKIKEEKGLEI